MEESDKKNIIIILATLVTSILSLGIFNLFFKIKYLQLLIDLVFKRKHYTFESIEKLTR